MTNQLSSKTAIVLGVTPGNMGHAIARRFVDDGASVLIAGRREDPLASVAAEIGAKWQRCDITSEQDLDALVATARDLFGRIDVGVNATGWGLLAPFEETSKDDLDRMAATQFVGPFQFFQRLVQNMTDGGSIIQISSVTASIMFENHAAYMGTKAGIDHVIRCIANEYGHRGIRANSIAPGGVADAPMSAGGLNYPPIQSLYLREIPLGRVGVSEDVASAAAWLAGDESSFVTGQVLHVSGGQTLRRNPSIADLIGATAAEQA
ncbi:SDR family NAD(P)-dependent oxidoreductase [Rhodococcus spongiicola]|uniref:SDR family oxidoreductase n=1 Tax=Rhodococcus spongiicola TaxID=2487352 RepID=A0A438AUP1_9NOCA|nr:SDR family oxidoreductase [Rhodococcus spongiicola]RVW02379.1 SDR family oxidoreductase [Rhodococcus spongiicola]